MEDILIMNAKDVSYKELSLSKIFAPKVEPKHSFEFKTCNVSSPNTSGGKLNVCLYILEPGKENYPYHYHSSEEEVFYIISGNGTLKTPKGEKDVKEGDIIVFPPNENGAHQLKNTSDGQLVYLDIDTVSIPEVIFYPEQEKILVKGKTGFLKSYKINSEINYLEGE